MQTEFEATFLNINKDEIRKQLKKIGAVLIYPEYLMKRVVFHSPIEINGGWLRVRQEAEKVTMTLKIVDGDKIENQKETEIIIDDFKKGVELLNNIGAKQKAYQETRRELWKIDGVEITIDTWPGLKPYLEVEGDNEVGVKLVSEKLGLNYGDAKFCEVSFVYEKELGIPPEIMKDQMPIITFENPPKKYG